MEKRKVQLAVVLLCLLPARVASGAADRECCGSITPAGHRLAELLDSLHVEELWIAHQHVNWETGRPDHGGEYLGPGHTHCSAFAAAVGKRLGIYMLRPPEHPQKLLANAQAEWFSSQQGRKDGWSELSDAREAQTAANRGDLAVVVYANPDPDKPGHIAVVRPSDKSEHDLRREGPQIIQAGEHNRNSTVVKLGFKNHPGAWPDGVRYFTHSVDERRYR